jgi:hypothetical protein
MRFAAYFRFGTSCIISHSVCNRDLGRSVLADHYCKHQRLSDSRRAKMMRGGAQEDPALLHFEVHPTEANSE